MSALELFRSVWGEEPHSFQKQASPLAPSVAQGRRGSLAAICISNPTRIEFSLMAASPEHAADQMSIPLIEDAALLTADLGDTISKVSAAADVTSIVRVALNLQFLDLKGSIADANKAVVATIPSSYGVSLTDEADFIFQVNRPYQSREVQDITMNCVTKWSVDRLQVVTMAIPVGGAPATVNPSSVMPQKADFTAASVRFDINNVPVKESLAGPQQSSLLREAMTNATQMAHDFGLGIRGLQNE